MNVNKRIGKLDPVQRKKVEARAAELISRHFSHTETETFRKEVKRRGLTDASTRRCAAQRAPPVFDEGWRAPWDTFVRPQAFAHHSNGGGMRP